MSSKQTTSSWTRVDLTSFRRETGHCVESGEDAGQHPKHTGTVGASGRAPYHHRRNLRQQAASLALHESLGFERVACFREVGYKFGRQDHGPSDRETKSR